MRSMKHLKPLRLLKRCAYSPNMVYFYQIHNISFKLIVSISYQGIKICRCILSRDFFILNIKFCPNKYRYSTNTNLHYLRKLKRCSTRTLYFVYWCDSALGGKYCIILIAVCYLTQRRVSPGIAYLRHQMYLSMVLDKGKKIST